MPLIKQTFELSLKNKIKDIEKKLYDALKDEKEGIYKAQQEIDKTLSKNIPNKNFDAEAYKKKVWNTIADNWAKSISKQAIDVLSTELSKILADEITSYIKSSTVITPSGNGSIQ